MLKIRKNDKVKVLSGKDKGKTGKVLRIDPSRDSAIVEGVNFVTKHARKTRQEDKGGIQHKESPLSVSKLQVICKGCNRPVRVGFDVLKDGSKVRFCKKCNEVL